MLRVICIDRAIANRPVSIDDIGRWDRKLIKLIAIMA